MIRSGCPSGGASTNWLRINQRFSQHISYWDHRVWWTQSCARVVHLDIHLNCLDLVNYSVLSFDPNWRASFGPSTAAHQRIPHLWHVTTSGKPRHKETNPTKCRHETLVRLLWNNIAMNTQSPTRSRSHTKACIIFYLSLPKTLQSSNTILDTKLPTQIIPNRPRDSTK